MTEGQNFVDVNVLWTRTSITMFWLHSLNCSNQKQSNPLTQGINKFTLPDVLFDFHLAHTIFNLI